MTDFEGGRDDVIATHRAIALLVDLDADRLGEDAELVDLLDRLGDDLRCWWTSRRQHEAALTRLEEGSYTNADVKNAAEVHDAARTSVVQTCGLVADRAAWLREIAEQESAR